MLMEDYPYDRKGNTVVDAIILGQEVVISPDGKVRQEVLDVLNEWKRAGRRMALLVSQADKEVVLQNHLTKDLIEPVFTEGSSRKGGLEGSYYQSMLNQAALEMGARPENCIFLDTTPEGVRAGQEAFLGLVVGIAPYGLQHTLVKAGADQCVRDLKEFHSRETELICDFLQRQGEAIFPYNQEVFDVLRQKRPAIFLDYDGTLTPIVARPEDALLDKEMRDILRELSDLFTVAVVTGRDKEDVEVLVGLDEIIYAGSHGYIISGPNGLQMEHPDSAKIIPVLDAMEQELRVTLKGRTEGTQIDRKRYAIGIHYRNARPQDEGLVFSIARQMLEKFPGYKIGEGKKIVEIKPDLDWHKGKAVEWILDALKLSDRSDILPVFIGDDITDEDAFEALREKGMGILVGGHGQKTHAAYALKNVFQVKACFRKLIEMYRLNS